MKREEFLCTAFNLHVLPGDYCNDVCCVTGIPISIGILAKTILSKSMGDVADIVKVRSEYIGIYAASCMKASKVLRGNLCAFQNKGVHPFVSSESATDKRPAWTALLHEIQENTMSLMIFTDESKKRIWPSVRLSTYGEAWRPYLHTGNSIPSHVSRELFVSRSRFLACLDFIEDIYSHGFSKYAIQQGLLDISSQSAIKEHGIEYTISCEVKLSQWRGTDEMLLALFIAQKHPIQILTKQEEMTCKKKNTVPYQLDLW